jgi:hypothetical protein
MGNALLRVGVAVGDARQWWQTRGDSLQQIRRRLMSLRSNIICTTTADSSFSTDL